MPTANDLIEVRFSPDEALDAAEAALWALGWRVTDSAEQGLEALEDPATLNCRTSPSRMRVRVRAAPAGGSVLMLDVEAPGIGPIPGPARLRRQIAAFESRVKRITGAEGAD